MHRNFRRRIETLGKAFLAFGGIFAVIVGCGGTRGGSISGQVLRSDGTPVVGATVTARSNETGKWASGITDAQGRYALKPPGKEQLPPGDYYLVIADAKNPGFDANQQPPSTIPSKYQIPDKSGLRVTLSAGAPTVFDVKLDPK